MPMLTEEELAEATAAAERLGEEHARGAASWVFDGNTPQEDYERVLKGIREGDPEILDALPSSPLSGEWADSMTAAKLIEELGWEWEVVSEYQRDQLCDYYTDGFNNEVVSEVERICLSNVPESTWGAW